MAEQLTKECGSCSEADLSGCLAFEASDISFSDHAVHAQGKLAQFLDNLTDGHRTVKPSVVYATLRDEVVRRNNASPDSVRAFEDVGAVKGFSRTTFQALLESLGLAVSLPELWQQVEQRLNAERVPWGEVARLKRRWNAMEAGRVAPVDRLLQRLIMRIDTLLPPFLTDGVDTLANFIEAVVGAVRTVAGDAADGFGDDDVKALALMRLYEARELPEARPSAAKEEPWSI